VILEQVVISGSGNGTRVNVDAVARDFTQIEDDILTLLQKRERRHAGRPSRSNRAADQSRIVDVRNDEIDFQGLDRAIAGYEPRRIISRKAKRKIVDGLNGTHGK